LNQEQSNKHFEALSRVLDIARAILDYRARNICMLREGFGKPTNKFLKLCKWGFD